MREPRYWGTWKGRVARAIAEYGPLTWGDIRDITGLSRDSLNTVLSEMYDAQAIERKGDEYWLNYELYKEYQDFLYLPEEPEGKPVKKTKKPTVKFSSSEQKDLVTWIDIWKEGSKLDFSLKPQHFYLTTDSDLDDFSKKLIREARKEVLVVNPYVEKCILSDTIREVAGKGKSVLLITRPPEDDRFGKSREAKKKYHESLRHAKVRVIENERVHAKIVVVDRRIAIISSMNFLVASYGGKSWESGIVTINIPVVEKVIDSIMKIQEEYESKER